MTSFSGDINAIPDAPGIEVEEGAAPGELDGPGIPVDISDFGGAPELGLNEFDTGEQAAVEGDTEASPVADPGSTPPPPASPAPPQLDPTQQMFLGMYQNMQEQAQANQRAMAELVASLKPKQEAPPVDPFADMPPDLRKAIDGNPELKAYTEYMAKKAQAPADQYRQEIEKRIEDAKFQRQVDQFQNEARQVAESVISSGYKLEGTAKQHVHDFLVDTALSLTNARGGSPIQYLEAVKKVFETGVQGRQAYLGEQVKQRVATRPTPQINAPRAAAPGMVSGQQAGPPSEAELRQAGYANRTEAIMNGYRKVQQLRALRMGQG
jgi:hypothetical protein